MLNWKSFLLYHEDIWYYSILERSDFSIGLKMILREWTSTRYTSPIAIQHYFRKLRHGKSSVDNCTSQTSSTNNSCAYSVSSGKNRVQFHIASKMDHMYKNGVLFVVLVAFFILRMVLCQYWDRRWRYISLGRLQWSGGWILIAQISIRDILYDEHSH